MSYMLGVRYVRPIANVELLFLYFDLSDAKKPAFPKKYVWLFFTYLAHP
jgi:hypothetical protein